MLDLSRRNILRGILRGSAITVALPFLDLFLDGSGEALAAGAPIPTRFGTWFWGCGVNAKRFFPDATGTDFTFKDETHALTPFKAKTTIFSGFNVILDGQPNLTHWSGIMGALGGTTPSKGGNGIGTAVAPTLDCLIADHVSAGTRFKSLQMACTGQSSVSYSMRAGNTVNPSDVDPVTVYKRLFGPDFQDPNSGKFTPDTKLMVEQSVLSSVKDGRENLMRKVGAADRARLDEYFTSIREVEQQLAVQLQPPAPAEACRVPKMPAALEPGTTWEAATQMHDQLTDLLVMALACNQTRVFHVALSAAVSNLRRAGQSVALHELTHEEPIDDKLGYQIQATYFLERSMEVFASLLGKLDAVKEGNGTLLDHSLILALSESNLAKLHTLESLPMVVAGSAGGKWRAGQHVSGKGDTTSRVGLTLQQVMGLPVGSWGTGPNATSKSISEVIV
ncbi:DUF1552 domain-containing protein [Novosphingobium sp. ST904]|uniref:DUF1552 domain-containing protein n=1 Tax=Novosphingobium sp. ST904 TaxID=1684385 RepID=UPI0006CC9E12|nr:DUF1552 domain-containing protein [Novosphingobium sp. ST904]KPH69288.1 hypothetical protein ADT71_00480 [Novosphingobium sp. ST904]TCM19057.1 uncharacterized protein DUF1552 [Novosphingobium sp. ST904]